MRKLLAAALGSSLAVTAWGQAIPVPPSPETLPKDSFVFTKFKDLPLKPNRTIPLKTAEGTWTSVDISPDGKTLLFDLMGDIYTVPISGGQAQVVTTGI